MLRFSKTSDKVPFERLKYKLKWYGINRNIHNWVSDFLSNHTQRVTVDGASYPTATVDSGAPRGSVHGPILFLLYINDLPKHLQHGSNVNFFADNNILYRTGDSNKDA